MRLILQRHIRRSCGLNNAPDYADKHQDSQAQRADLRQPRPQAWECAAANNH